MFATAEIKALRNKKQQLLLESEINRQVLVLECIQLKSSFRWTQTGVRWFKTIPPAWLILAPVAGYLVARSFRSERGWLHKAIVFGEMIRKLLPFWQTVKGFLAKP
jgi:hypothetical protein